MSTTIKQVMSVPGSKGKLNSSALAMVLLALSAQLLGMQSATASGLTTTLLQPVSSRSNSLDDQPPPPTTTELPDATTTMVPVEPITSKPSKKKPLEDLIDHLQHKIRDTPDAIMVAMVQLKENIKLLADFFQRPYKPKSFESTSFSGRASRVDKV